VTWYVFVDEMRDMTSCLDKLTGLVQLDLSLRQDGSGSDVVEQSAKGLAPSLTCLAALERLRLRLEVSDEAAAVWGPILARLRKLKSLRLRSDDWLGLTLLGILVLAPYLCGVSALMRLKLPVQSRAHVDEEVLVAALGHRLALLERAVYWCHQW
jgi:hypothetical protein